MYRSGHRGLDFLVAIEEILKERDNKDGVGGITRIFAGAISEDGTITSEAARDIIRQKGLELGNMFAETAKVSEATEIIEKAIALLDAEPEM